MMWRVTSRDFDTFNLLNDYIFCYGKDLPAKRQAFDNSVDCNSYCFNSIARDASNNAAISIAGLHCHVMEKSWKINWNYFKERSQEPQILQKINK